MRTTISRRIRVRIQARFLRAGIGSEGKTAYFAEPGALGRRQRGKRGPSCFYPSFDPGNPNPELVLADTPSTRGDRGSHLAHSRADAVSVQDSADGRPTYAA